MKLCKKEVCLWSMLGIHTVFERKQEKEEWVRESIDYINSQKLRCLFSQTLKKVKSFILRCLTSKKKFLMNWDFITECLIWPQRSLGFLHSESLIVRFGILPEKSLERSQVPQTAPLFNRSDSTFNTLDLETRRCFLTQLMGQL